MFVLWETKYGQLGQGQRYKDTTETLVNTEQQLVESPLSNMDSGCLAIYSRWSHIIPLLHSQNTSGGGDMVYGWGRNDKGQLGMISTQSHLPVPQILKPMLNAIDSGDGAIRW